MHVNIPKEEKWEDVLCEENGMSNEEKSDIKRKENWDHDHKSKIRGGRSWDKERKTRAWVRLFLILNPTFLLSF